MAEIINLRRARKARDKAQAAAEAEARRAAHGRTKAERDHTSRLAEQERARLDALKRDDQ